eukprot:JP446967.1.p2 GENE.JP446967.1~~JP446967.1.p2  ORF type:complete len:154 (-),score=52.07 JP446967.1:245-706(-)
MQIFARTPSKTFSLHVEHDDTILSIKEQLHQHDFAVPQHQRLMLNGSELFNDAVVADCHMREEATIIAAVNLCGGTMINVKTLTGNIIQINIDSNDKIMRIKERVEEKEGIPPVQQRLIFGGKQMSDEKTVSDYNIEGGATLHLVLSLRGGVC